MATRWDQTPDYLEACRRERRADDPVAYRTDVESHSGCANVDYTEFIAGQASWSTGNLPNILYTIDRPEEQRIWMEQNQDPQQKRDANGQLLFERWPRPGTDARPIWNFPVLPDQIAFYEVWFRIEAWRRLDGRISYADIAMRQMPKDGLRNESASQEHKRLYDRVSVHRQLFILDWYPVKNKDVLFNQRIRSINDTKQLQSNCSRGLTPGLIDPKKGDVPDNVVYFSKVGGWPAPTIIEAVPERPQKPLKRSPAPLEPVEFEGPQQRIQSSSRPCSSVHAIEGLFTANAESEDTPPRSFGGGMLIPGKNGPRYQPRQRPREEPSENQHQVVGLVSSSEDESDCEQDVSPVNEESSAESPGLFVQQEGSGSSRGTTPGRSIDLHDDAEDIQNDRSEILSKFLPQEPDRETQAEDMGDRPSSPNLRSAVAYLESMRDTQLSPSLPTVAAQTPNPVAPPLGGTPRPQPTNGLLETLVQELAMLRVTVLDMPPPNTPRNEPLGRRVDRLARIALDLQIGTTQLVDEIAALRGEIDCAV